MLWDFLFSIFCDADVISILGNRETSDFYHLEVNIDSSAAHDMWRPDVKSYDLMAKESNKYSTFVGQKIRNLIVSKIGNDVTSVTKQSKLIIIIWLIWVIIPKIRKKKRPLEVDLNVGLEIDFRWFQGSRIKFERDMQSFVFQARVTIYVNASIKGNILI